MVKEKNKIPHMTLRDYVQTCRVRVKIGGKIKEAKLSFGDGYNTRPIGNEVYLDPLGWFNTDDVELLEVLPYLQRTTAPSPPILLFNRKPKRKP